MTVYEKYLEIQKINLDTEIPFEVRRFFKDFKQIEISGNQISFGEDYGTLSEVRSAVRWIVNQLGGTVEWEKSQF